MVLFHQYWSSTTCHLLINYRCIQSCTRFSLDQILSHHNSTLVMGKFECLLGQESLLVGYLGGSVLTVDMDGVVKKIRVTSVFGSQFMLVGSLGVSVT